MNKFSRLSLATTLRLKPSIMPRGIRQGLSSVMASLFLTALLLGACGDSATPTNVLPSPTAINTPIKAGAESAFGTVAGGATSPTARAVSTTAAASSTQAGAVSTAAGAAKTGGTLRLSLAQEPDTLIPSKSSLTAGGDINNMVYDRLFYIGKDALPKPWLAESWNITDEGKTITFKIRQGIKFHDGTPLNAAAVKFSFDYILDAKNAAPAKAFVGSLESVEAPDDTTAIFKFKTPFASFFANMSNSNGGIMSPTAFAKLGDQYSRNPVGTGPFKFKSWKTGQELVLERNPDYKGFREDVDNKGAPYLDSVIFTLIPDPSTQIASLEQGSLDITDLQVENAPRLKVDPRFSIFELKQTTSLTFLDMSNRAPFNSVDFRKAISYALDRKMVVDSATSGLATLNTAPLPNGVAGWDGSLNPYPYDPAKAKDLLKSAGWTPGPDGILQKEGKSASFSLITYSGNSTWKRALEIIQSQLKDIGIEAKIQIMEISAAVALFNKGEFDMALRTYVWPDPSFLYNVFRHNATVQRTEDPELENFFIKTDSTLDPPKRLEMVKQAQKMVLDRAIVAPIYSQWIIRAIQKKILGYKLDAIGTVLYNDISIA